MFQKRQIMVTNVVYVYQNVHIHWIEYDIYLNTLRPGDANTCQWAESSLVQTWHQFGVRQISKLLLVHGHLDPTKQPQWNCHPSSMIIVAVNCMNDSNLITPPGWHHHHDSDVTSASWCLKSLVTRLFNSLIRLSTKKTSKVRITGHLWTTMHYHGYIYLLSLGNGSLHNCSFASCMSQQSPI